MATNKTDYLKLNDWVGSDPFRREEINANFRTLDAKAKEHEDSIGDLTTLQTTDKSSLVKAVNENTSSLAEKANQKTNVFNKKTFGTFGNAAVLSSMGNEPSDNPKPQVLGLTTTQQASTYSNRDSVAFYNSNRSKNPTFTTNTGTITYASLSVQFTGDATNLSKVVSGMLIDTLHTPNHWASIVDYVDVANKTIYIKDGWYLVQDGGSATPSLPPNNIGFDVDLLTRVWGINNNVFLFAEDKTNSAVAEEIGLFNNVTDGATEGIDVVNFENKSNYGVRVRHKDSEPGVIGFSDGFVAQDTDSAFTFIADYSTQFLTKSVYNGNSSTDGFQLTAEGKQNKVRLFATVYTNGQNVISSTTNKMIILNKTVVETFTIPTPVGRSGEILFVLNQGTVNADLNVTDGKNIVYDSRVLTAVTIVSKNNAILVSDGNSWIVVSGLMDRRPVNARTGTAAPTVNADYVGQVYVDTTNKISYMAVATGTGATDWKQITN
ncbi:hypothetical protein COJ96_06035 [Bacillus sp. AFS073361]|uniref:hypothetical protein n=1 Tax=Bacillus sp. AFS073361 TaxID=2033511 RepID=UPI000BF283A0|nr:hypothetical protein [Bacillus sp. AFS073361]PFP30269.1 hypothetical protein COJ96_06035 [Bacillus sp. AFS073361]